MVFESEGNFENHGEGYVAMAIITCFVAATFASAGGIGGGGIMLPILLVVGGFPYSGAITLSLSACLSNTATQILINLPKRHPMEESRPLINYDIISVLLPCQLAGAKIGFVLEHMLPGGLLLILAMIILLSAGVSVVRKGAFLWKKESKLIFDYQDTGLRDNLMNNIGIDNSMRESILSIGSNGGDSQRIRSSTIRDEAKIGYRVINTDYSKQSDNATETPYRGSNLMRKSHMEQMEEVHEYNLEVVPSHKFTDLRNSRIQIGRQETINLEDIQEAVNKKTPMEVPYFSIGRISTFYALFASLIIIATTLYTFCDEWYYILTAIGYVPLVIAFLTGIYFVSRNQAKHPEIVLIGDLDFSSAGIFEIYLVPIILFIIGVLCSLLGIGGGEMIGPTFLNMGMLPMVAGATTSFMATGNSFINVTQYLLTGMITYDWFLLMAFTGMMGGVCGKRMSRYVISTTGRASFNVFALGGILLVSVCLLSFQLAIEPSFAFHDLQEFCGKKDL